MKKISVLIPTLNEEENIELLIYELEKELGKYEQYDYEIVFIDNFSTDNTKNILEEICSKDKNVKAIFNSKNFGVIKSPLYGFLQVTGDCVIMFNADFQDPIDLIPKFIEKWEKGYEAVVGVKVAAKEFFVMRSIRALAYDIISKYSYINHIKHYDGVGLYDRVFIEKVRELVKNDVEVQFRNLVTELNVKYATVEFEHQKRRKGKSKINLFVLYDYGINSMILYTKILPRIGIGIGIGIGIVSCIALIFEIICGILNGFMNNYLLIGIGITFLTLILSLVMFFLGIVMEYIKVINSRFMKRPLVLEEKRINFDEE